MQPIIVISPIYFMLQVYIRQLSGNWAWKMCNSAFYSLFRRATALASKQQALYWQASELVLCAGSIRVCLGIISAVKVSHAPFSSY